VDGEVIVFRRLARELGTVRPVYGLQPFGLLVQAPTVERLAAAYIEEIRKKGEPQSFGLVGYSFGGLVAVEMARQLRRKGVVPTAVMLIDTNYPAGCRVRESWAERLERYRYSWDEIVRGRGVSYLVERLKFGFARLMHRASARAGISSAMAYGEVSTLQLLASESYRIRSYDGRVFLFRAETQPDFFTGGPDLGWSGVLSDLVVEDIPGDHGTINTGTNLKVLAQKIRDCL
jgi:thioesterase domain-containing protein